MDGGRPSPAGPAHPSDRRVDAALHRSRRGGGRHPDHGGPRGAGDRRGRGVRAGSGRPRRAEERAALAALLRRGGGPAGRHAADGGEPLLGHRADARRRRGPSGRSRGGRRPPRAGGGGHPGRGRGREPVDGGARREAPPAEGVRAHALQRGGARHGGVRDGAGRVPGSGLRREEDPRVRGRDAPVPAGGPADGVGADEGRHPLHPDHGQHGGDAVRGREDRRRRRGGGPDRGERGRGEQGRHVRRRRALQGAQGAVLRGRAALDDRQEAPHGGGDPHRAARPFRGDAPHGQARGARRRQRVQPRLRRDPGPVRVGHHHRERGHRAAAIRPPSGSCSFDREARDAAADDPRAPARDRGARHRPVPDPAVGRFSAPPRRSTPPRSPRCAPPPRPPTRTSSSSTSPGWAIPFPSTAWSAPCGTTSCSP